jgi:hypothetical protein
MGAFDDLEGITCDDPTFLCSNDNDFSTVTPIITGIMMYISGRSMTVPSVGAGGGGTFIDLNMVGQYGSSGTVFPEGARFRGAWYDFDVSQVDFPYIVNPNSGFPQSIAWMPDLTNGNVFASPDDVPEILVGAPGAMEERGEVVLTFGQNMLTFRFDAAKLFNSIPQYECAGTFDCFANRIFWYPNFQSFVGQSPGDHLGYADAAGDFNQDGVQDILMGAPGADRNGLVDNGALYVVLGRVDLNDLGSISFSSGGLIMFGAQNPPRVEIHGVTPNEGLGGMNKFLGDVSGDGLPDVAFAAPKFDPSGLTDAGMVGILFGGRRLTGENIFLVTEVATNRLPGVRFLGTQNNGLAGAKIAPAGDFNADGFPDLLVVAPNETRVVDGTTRRGIAYLIFGGYHLNNGVFDLSQVGTSQVPGLVFATPYAVGTADEANIEAAEAAGDVDGDGFGDILIGVPNADYVNPSAPSQRRVDAGEAYLIYGTNAIAPVD